MPFWASTNRWLQTISATRFAQAPLLRPASHLLGTNSTRHSYASTPSDGPNQTGGGFGIVFDVDGVLLKGSTVVPSAGPAIRKLLALQVPFVVLTNGGGMLESARSELLSRKLDAEFKPSQIIQSHTPMRQLVEEHAEDNVLLVGKRYENLKAVAASYGFKKVTTVEDMHIHHPRLYPDIKPGSDEVPQGFPQEPVKAVLIMNDPTFWGREVQVCIDVLRCNGSGDLGHQTVPAGTQHVKLYNSCSDLEYSTELPVPRLGAGAFKEALSTLFLKTTGHPLQQVEFGKPEVASYKFAEMTLCQNVGEEGALPERFYMVGDNPKTDI
eukprot:gene6115-7340_t